MSCPANPVVTEADVASAVASGNTVLIDLNQEAATRFGAATKANTGRRMVIVIDGKVYGAPIANGAIDARHFEITVASAADAAPLSRALTPVPRRAP